MPGSAAAASGAESASSPASPAAAAAGREPRTGTPVEARGAGETGSKTATTDANYVVQLAAFADDKGANALASKLKRNGYPAFTEPVRTTRGTLYRVRVGAYPSRDAAGDARNKLKADGYSGIIAQAH